ncbi:MAG: hypothetical protein ACLGI6_15470, partial [Gammaproteobacteria bacterium]
RFARGQSRPWRVMVERSVPHADGLLLLSVPLKKEALNFIAAMEDITQMAAILPVVENKAYWTVRPELTVRRQRTAGTRTDETSLGAEISARPGANWVLNATLNPDFSQVEIDEPTNAGASQIALSLPEKRAFFLESADVLGLRLPGFYSRTVADPRWGARVTWRGLDADASALTVADRAGGIVMRGHAYGTDEYVNLGDSTATLVRARWHGDGSVAGVQLSQRDYGAGGSNRVVGADGQARLGLFDSGDTQALWGLMASSTTAHMLADGVPRRASARSAGYLFGKVDYRSDDWLNVVQLEAIGPGFVNDNGFVPQSGVVKAEVQINRRLGARQIGLGDASLFDTYETELHLGLIEDRTLADAQARVEGGQVIRRLVRPGVWLYAARQTRFWADLGLDRYRARSDTPLRSAPAVHMGWETSPLPWLIRVAGEMSLGRRLDFDADRVGRGGNVWMEVGMRFPLAGGWSLESDHRFNRAWVRHAGREGFAEHGWRWVGTLHMSARDSIRVIAQQVASDRYEGTRVVMEPWSERAPHRSVLYRYIHRHGRTFSLGATSDANGTLPGKSKGVTAKLQWEM